MDFHHHHQAMNELDQLRSQVETLERDNAQLRASLDPWLQFLSARWFNLNTLLAPNTLRKARRYLPHLELGGRLYYRVLDVFRRWPDRFIHPRTGKMPELPQLEKGIKGKTFDPASAGVD